MGAQAVALAKAVNYDSVGTVEVTTRPMLSSESQSFLNLLIFLRELNHKSIEP